MHDDVGLVMAEGWLDSAKPRKAIEDKERKLTETPDLVIGSGKKANKYKMDLVPPGLIKARYFADELTKLEELTAQSEAAAQELELFIEENGGEEALISSALDEDKVKKPLAAARLKVAKTEPDSQDEVTALTTLIQLIDAEAEAKRAAKVALDELDVMTLSHYGKLNEDEVKKLVIANKWGGTISIGVDSVIAGLIQGFAVRVELLASRYASTLGEIEFEVEEMSLRVSKHLVGMRVRE
jgi:type I restriction enzyme M protein